MRVAYCSDIHYDIWFGYTRNIPIINNDCQADVLLLAGDIFEYHKWSTFFHKNILDRLCTLFKHVILIDGNHEYYDLDFESMLPYKIFEDAPENFHYLRNEHILIDGITFYGGTFWTNPLEWSPLERFDVNKQINDFKYIKHMTYEDMSLGHIEFMNGLYGCLYGEQFSEKEVDNVVVISHFPPSELSIDPEYAGHLSNAYFTNRYFDEFYTSNQIKHWICGHVHHKHDFEIGKIKGHCNPVGYPTKNQNQTRDNVVDLKYFDI